MKSTVEIYRNNKGIVLNGKYNLGFDGKFEFHQLINKDVFYIHFLFFHFFYLKKQ